MEGEIKALKEKLRSADEEIQQLRTGISNTSVVSSSSALVGMLNESKTNQSEDELVVESNVNAELPTDSNETICQMCKNYESQLVSAQSEKDTLSKDIERFNEELSKEAALRHDLESKWQEKRDEYNEQVQQLIKKVECNEKEYAALQRHYMSFKDEVNEEFSKMTNEREMIHRHLTTLQDDNDFLSGRYMASSEEMQNQLIDLPNTVEELQETLLKSHQSLIEARVGCEFHERKCNSYADETQILRDQLQATWTERQASEREFIGRIKGLEYVVKDFNCFLLSWMSISWMSIFLFHRTRLKVQESERLKLLNKKIEYEVKETTWDKEKKDLCGQIIELTETNVSA